MKILQRYVLREILSPTLLALLALTLVLVIILVFSQFEEVAAVISLPALGRLAIYLLPSILSIAIPMAILTGVLLGVGRLTVDSEIKALRTHGVSLYRVFLPALALGVVAVGLVLANSLYVAPLMLRQSMTLVDELRSRLFESLEPGRFEKLSPNGNDLILYFADKDQKSELLKNVYLWYDGSLPEEKKDKNRSSSTATSATAALANGASDPTSATAASESGAGHVVAQMKIPMPQGNVAERSAYTVEFWAKTTASGKKMAAVGFGNKMDDNASWIFCGMNAEGGVQFSHIAEDGGVTISLPSARINDGAWHHVACVHGADGLWQVYRDGKLLSSVTKPLGVTFIDRAKIGVLPRVSETFAWDGLVGYVRISRKARSAEEIAKSWANGPGKKIKEDAFQTWAALPSVEAPGQKKDDTKDDKDLEAGKTLFLASSGSVGSERKRRSFTLTLINGTMHFLGGRDNEIYSTISFEKMKNEMPWGSEEDFMSKDGRTAEASTIGEINKSIQEYKKKGTAGAIRRMRQLVATKYQRVSISLACFAFVLIGLPLAIYIRPSGKSVGISIAFCLIAFYYLVMHFGVVLTQKGVGMGPLMIFMPNIILMILGVFMLRRSVHR